MKVYKMMMYEGLIHNAAFLGSEGHLGTDFWLCFKYKVYLVLAISYVQAKSMPQVHITSSLFPAVAVSNAPGRKICENVNP